MGQKIDIFFHHCSIAYPFRNTHVKFQAGIRKIVDVMNFFVTSCSTSGFWRADFKRVFLETMFFKLACTITKEQLHIFQKFLYRIKLYSVLNRITSRKMWKKFFIPLFFNKFDEKNKNFANFVVIFVKITFFKKQKRHSIEDSKTNKKHCLLQNQLLRLYNARHLPLRK